MSEINDSQIELREQYDEYKKKNKINITFAEYLNIFISSQIILNAILSGSLKSINNYLLKNKIEDNEEIKKIKPVIENFYEDTMRENNNRLGVIETSGGYKLYRGGIGSIKTKLSSSIKPLSDTKGSLIREIDTNPEVQSPAVLIGKSYLNNTLNISKGIVGNVIKLSDHFVTRVIDIASGNSLSEPWMPQTNERIIVLAKYFKEAAKDPKVIEAVKEISENITNTGLQITDAVLPGLQKIIDKFIKTAEKMGTQGAEGAMRTFISMASSTISLVPWIGGFISILISIGSAFNTAMGIVLTFTRSSGEQAITSANVTKEVMDITFKNKRKITDSFNKLTSAIYGDGNNSGIIYDLSSKYRESKEKVNDIYKEITKSRITDYIKRINDNEVSFNKDDFKDIIKKSILDNEIKNPFQLITIINFLKTRDDVDIEYLKNIGILFNKKYPIFEKKIDELLTSYNSLKKNTLLKYINETLKSREKPFSIEEFKEKINESIKNGEIKDETAKRILTFIKEQPTEISFQNIMRFLIKKSQSITFQKGGIYKNKKYKKGYINSTKRITNSLHKFYNTRKLRF